MKQYIKSMRIKKLIIKTNHALDAICVKRNCERSKVCPLR